MRRLLFLCLILPALAEDDRPLVAKRLEDSDWVVRALAAKSVGDDRRDMSLPFLRDRLAKETNEYVQAFALKSLQAFPLKDLARAGGKGLVPAALRPLKAKSPYVRAQADAALRHLTGLKEGDWEAWWKAQEASFGFALPKEAPGKGGAAVEVKTHAAGAFEEVVYEARRKGLEVVFVLDQTSSMQAAIDAAKAEVLDLCGYLHLLVPKYEVGLVTYDDAPQVRFPLTQDFPALQKRLAGVSAVGGGDTPEGVDQGISAALGEKMGWSKGARKVLVVIGDAPPHAPDVPPLLERLKKAVVEGWTVNVINVGPMPVAEFQKIAEAGKGTSVSAGGSALVSQMLILSLGDEHRKALEGFVEVVRKVREKPPKP